MLNYIDSNKMGRSKLGWLDSHFHFSFAEYYNPDNMQFGVLRVINDDLISPHTGFDTHPHKNMEIISYVVQGEISHGDSMNNKRLLSRGQVQYLSAGTGITHSEHNLGDTILRLLQIWIMPDKNGHVPNYGDYKFNMEDRVNKWMPLVTSFENQTNKAPIQIHADVNMYASIITKDKTLDFDVALGRQAYLVLVEGSAHINGLHLSMRDALEITEESITIHPDEETHILIIEMENKL